jgi:N6-L-threonylcarbamoyladenine synthase
MDDAAGEAFDKTAQLLGLGYPGGPAVSALAARGRAGRFRLPRPMMAGDSLDFSFSGLKTAVLLAQQEHGTNVQARADIAAEFQEAVADVLVTKALRACEQAGLERLVVAGGVGANTRLRERLVEATTARGIDVHFPELALCTDNGAMIAFAGALRMAHGGQRDYTFTVRPRWDLDQLPASGL